MEKACTHNTKLQLLKRPLKKQLDSSVIHAINALKDNEKVENTTLRMNLLISNYARKAGNIIYFSNKTNFQNKKGALDLASNYFNAKWARAFNHALVKNRFYKTPNGGIVYVPKGEISHFNDDGAVYGIKVDDKEYFWDYREELYYDVYNNIYNPNGDIIIGNRTPRYIKEAYKSLLKIRVKHPNANLYPQQGDGYKEAVIAIHHSDMNMTIFGGPGTNFDTKRFPEVGTGESFAPIWGSGKQAYYDFQDGDYGWGVLNTGMAISDVFLIKSIYQGISKGGLKAMTMGNKPWTGVKDWYDPSTNYSRFYKVSGFKAEGEVAHHWFFQTKGSIGKYVPNSIKNQMFNLKRYGSQASHMRWGHGTGYPSLGLDPIPFAKLAYPIMGTPTWFKAGVISSGMRGFENYKRDE